MRFLIDPILLSVYSFLIGLPVGLLAGKIDAYAFKHRDREWSDWVDGIGTAVNGVAVALTFPILYPLIVGFAIFATIWIEAARAVINLF